MVRLKEIAAVAGVSVMTVSKALRNKPDLSVATKERIRKLAAEMGYVPDISAQQLRSRTTRLLGLVISASTNPVNARIVMAIEERAHELGYDLILAHTLNRPEREEAVLRRLISRRVDGLFITPVYRFEKSAPAYEELARHGIPTVILGHRAEFCQQYPAIETDDVAASAGLSFGFSKLFTTRYNSRGFSYGATATPDSVYVAMNYRF